MLSLNVAPNYSTWFYLWRTQSGATQRSTPGYNGTPGYCVVHHLSWSTCQHWITQTELHTVPPTNNFPNIRAFSRIFANFSNNREYSRKFEIFYFFFSFSFFSIDLCLILFYSCRSLLIVCKSCDCTLIKYSRKFAWKIIRGRDCNSLAQSTHTHLLCTLTVNNRAHEWRC